MQAKKSVITYVVLTAIAPQDINIANEISRLTTHCNCSIIKCSMTTMGIERTIMMLITGQWSGIAKLETQLDNFAKKNPVQLHHNRTQTPKFTEDLIPYNISVVALDSTGVMYKITDFFIKQNIHICEQQTETYMTQLTGSLMFTLQITILIPAKINIGELRDQFMLLCDEHNLDAVMEPERR